MLSPYLSSLVFYKKNILLVKPVTSGTRPRDTPRVAQASPTCTRAPLTRGRHHRYACRWHSVSASIASLMEDLEFETEGEVVVGSNQPLGLMM
jgi:hypothetical protein